MWSQGVPARRWGLVVSGETADQANERPAKSMNRPSFTRWDDQIGCFRPLALTCVVEGELARPIDTVGAPLIAYDHIDLKLGTLRCDVTLLPPWRDQKLTQQRACFIDGVWYVDANSPRLRGGFNGIPLWVLKDNRADMLLLENVSY